MTPDSLDLPDVVEEVSALFEAYERALAHHDASFLDACFWQSASTVRYGIREELYGSDEIAAWRRASPPVPPTRSHGPTVVKTFGRDFATTCTEFDNGDGTPRGRQTQTWVRLDDGWRIVAAHVSIRPTTPGRLG